MLGPSRTGPATRRPAIVACNRVVLERLRPEDRAQPPTSPSGSSRNSFGAVTRRTASRRRASGSPGRQSITSTGTRRCLPSAAWIGSRLLSMESRATTSTPSTSMTPFSIRSASLRAAISADMRDQSRDRTSMPDAPVTEDDASVYRCVAGFRVDSRVGNGAADGLEHCCLVLEVFEISDTRWSVSAPGAVFGVDAASRSAASRSTRTVSSSPLTSASTASSTRPNTASASPYLTRAILPIPPKTADAAPDRISAAVPVPLLDTNTATAPALKAARPPPTRASRRPRENTTSPSCDVGRPIAFTRRSYCRTSTGSRPRHGRARTLPAPGRRSSEPVATLSVNVESRVRTVLCSWRGRIRFGYLSSAPASQAAPCGRGSPSLSAEPNAPVQ